MNSAVHRSVTRSPQLSQTKNKKPLQVFSLRWVWNGSFWRSEALSTALRESRAGVGRLDTSSAYRLTAPGMHHCAESEVIASLRFVLKRPSWLIWEWGFQFCFCTAIPFSVMDLGHHIFNGLSFCPALSLAQGHEHGFLQRSQTYSVVCVSHVVPLYGGMNPMKMWTVVWQVCQIETWWVAGSTHTQTYSIVEMVTVSCRGC